MVYRVYVEKKTNLEAAALLRDLQSFLGLERLMAVRMLNRYDVEGVDAETLESLIPTVFSEPPLDTVYRELPPLPGEVFAVEYLPGQFDQRADSAAQCAQLITQGEKPLVKSARVYALAGDLSQSDIEAAKRYVINPVESREAALTLPETLAMAVEKPGPVPVVQGFLKMNAGALSALRREMGLAMDDADLLFCRNYFAGEKRDPTESEIRMLDTYWSDHCRHTTFLTELSGVTFDDAEIAAAYAEYMALRETLGVKKPVTLMDIATIGAKALKARGLLSDLDESDEINACTVKITANIDGKDEPWLLLFKNETHNHPTEIEPFGGAATCIGGAIRDPLSGRAYVYQAMRVTGAANPLRPLSETLPGKLPQRKITTTAAAGYSAYGNQIGLATGLVDELYHDGYAAKRMEIGAVVGAAPESHVRREVPTPGDIVVLLGGRTGRDGCGGATGSSKAHTQASLAQCGAEVQKGNAPEERKLQRLFRNPEATRLIKRCNDFGAGGVSVAVGELADGLEINLDKVPKKYEGLTGTELAISESQERMAVVLEAKDVDAFLSLADGENLEGTPVATVTEAPRLVMRWRGQEIVNIAREFLNSNGAPKQAVAHVPASALKDSARPETLSTGLEQLAGDLNVCSKRGLSERFDASIGAGSVLMPFGGARQMTPPQAMAALLPVLSGDTATASVMAYGACPDLMEQSPYHGAYLAVVESVAKLVATGAGYKGAHLTFQEYFERMHAGNWHKPLSALLGALKAQLDLGLAAIGGKDSMSGSFESLNVPPTLVSFAVNTAGAGDIISPEFKQANAPVRLLVPDGTPAGQLKVFDAVTALIQGGKVRAAYAVGAHGIAEALLKMCIGNRLGFRLDDGIAPLSLFDRMTGAFVLETDEPVGMLLGETTRAYEIAAGDETACMAALEKRWTDVLEPVFPTKTASQAMPVETFTGRETIHLRPAGTYGTPRVLIPVFPGTNCEWDSARAFERAGAEAETFVINNLTQQGVIDSAERFASRLSAAQILFLPGGFSGGDEPDGSGKFITAFLRNPRIADELMRLLTARDGLVGGICNGFQALIKLGLLPFGEMREPAPDAPTLTYNAIGRHQSRLVRTRVSSNMSPWLMHATPGDIHIAPVSHGEGRFLCDPELLARLARRGQIATQYVDDKGLATMDILCNINGSAGAVEGITSPDGRVFGRMAHSERTGRFLYKNVPGANQESPMFRGAADYFR